MGKKRVAKKGADIKTGGGRGKQITKLPRKKVARGVLHVQVTYNNTKLMLTETDGGAVVWSSSGGLGFKGAKKGTPFAAAEVGSIVGEKAKMLGMKEVDVVVRGVGSGRESAIRSFLAKSGSTMASIRDVTPVPHNGPRPRKPRRV